jgi:type II secretory ATPase GspE/PulE/Tfp pilus assembly ATPase PilB-like protein
VLLGLPVWLYFLRKSETSDVARDVIPDDALVDKISNGANLNEIRSAARDLGMRSLRADGLDKVKAGITTLEEVYRVTA